MKTPLTPYDPPGANVSLDDSGDVVTRPRGLAIASLVVAVVTGLCAGIAPQQLKTFRELYTGFGAELPWLSQVALGGMWIWTLLALVAVAIAIWVASTRLATRATIRRMRWAVAAHTALLVIVFLVTLIALYLPIFELGRVV